jgi:ATP-dependent Clp protease ATP-binding subunit ClpA
MTTVTLDHVCEVLGAWTGIAPAHLRPGGSKLVDVEEMRARLGEGVVGQEGAVDLAARALTRRARLAPRSGERRPLWTVLFAGPSGVGKSQLAKELARAFFGDADRHVIQVDLSDFRDEHTVARLVGAPPGYKGHGDGGELTNALRRVPAGVLLLDEVEKAHRAIIAQVLIPLLGEAVVRDMNDGRIIDASQFVVVITSNLGTAREVAKPLGFAPGTDAPDLARRVRDAITGFFSKEVLGRIDDVVVFSHLSEAAARRIWEREIDSLTARLSATGATIEVCIDARITDRLLAGASERIVAEGARAVRKVFDRAIVDRCIDLIGDAADDGRVVIQPADDGGTRYRFEPRG